MDDDLKPREGWPGMFGVTCGVCGEEFGTNSCGEETACAECEARRCPHCKTWFGGDEA